MSAQMNAPGMAHVVMGSESMSRCATMATLLMMTVAAKTATLSIQITSSAGLRLTLMRVIDQVI